MPDLAKAYVQIIPSAQGMQSAIEKEINGESMGASVGGKFCASFKKIIGAAAIGKFLKDSVMQGAELEQNLGGTEAVFGNFASNIQKEASTAYKNMGLSASDYMATANRMGSLFQGSGLSQQESLNMTSAAMQRAADVASVMGVDMNMAMESISGAAKGNFTMMDNLGVAMNATTLQAYALEKGINFNWNTASQAEKSELAMKMFMDRTSQYAGNFAKESSETIAGSFGAMKSSWQNFLGDLTLGRDIGPSIEALGTTVVNFAKNIIPAIVNILGKLPAAIMKILAGLAPQIAPLIVNTVVGFAQTLVESIPIILTAVSDILTGVVNGLIVALPILFEAIPQIITGLINNLMLYIPQILQAGITLLTALVQGLPIIIQSIVAALPQIINGIVTGILSNLPIIIQAGINLLVALIGALPQIITTIVAAIPQIISGVGNAITGNIPTIINCGVQLLVSLVKNLPKIIIEIVKALPQIITSMVSALGQGVAAFVNVGTNLIKGLWKGINDAKDWLWGKIKGFFGGIVDDIKEFFGIHSPSTLFANIGMFLDKGFANGIVGNLSFVEKAMNQLRKVASEKVESQLAIKATMPEVNYETDEDIGDENGRVGTTVQNIYINQPVKTPSETARAIREEALKLGLAG